MVIVAPGVDAVFSEACDKSGAAVPAVHSRLLGEIRIGLAPEILATVDAIAPVDATHVPVTSPVSVSGATTSGSLVPSSKMTVSCGCPPAVLSGKIRTKPVGGVGTPDRCSAASVWRAMSVQPHELARALHQHLGRPV